MVETNDAEQHTASGRNPGRESDAERRGVLRVVVADANRLYVTGIRRALEADDEIEIAGEACSGAEILPLVGRTSPDVVLLDLRMPELGGLSYLDQIRAGHPDVKVVMLANVGDRDRVPAALTHGASGYILKTVNPRDLPSALRLATESSVFHSLDMPQDTPGAQAVRRSGLTARELTILQGVARGLSNQAIARELWVTEQTVKFHLTNIYRKLGVSNRTEAARYAFMHTLVDPDDDAGAP